MGRGLRQRHFIAYGKWFPAVNFTWRQKHTELTADLTFTRGAISPAGRSK